MHDTNGSMIHNVTSSDVLALFWTSSRNSMECMRWRRWHKNGGRDNSLSYSFHLQTSPLQEIWIYARWPGLGYHWKRAGGNLILGLDEVDLHPSWLAWVACAVVYRNASPHHRWRICERRRSRCWFSFPIRMAWRPGMHPCIQTTWRGAIRLTSTRSASRCGKMFLEGTVCFPVSW